MKQKTNSDLKLTWDLTCFYNSDTDPKIEKDILEIESRAKGFYEKWENRSDYLEDPKILSEALSEYEILTKDYSPHTSVEYYCSLRLSQDQANPVLKALDNKISQLGIKVNNYLEFFTNRISKIPVERQKDFLKSSYLKEYTHFLEKIFAVSKYILSEPEEKILGALSKPAYDNWVQMVSSFLGKEEAKVLTEDKKFEYKSFSELFGLINSENKKVRDSAALALNKIFVKHLNVAEQEINSILETNKNILDIKKIDRPDKPRHLDDDIDSEVVDALVAGVSSNYDIVNRFYELKSKLLGVKKLAFHERNLMIGSVNKKYTYEEAVSLVKEVFGGLDKQFLEIYENMLDQGMFDVMPYNGKKSGAFCMHGVNSTPVFVLLNFNKTLNDISTIAHEMGHAINDTMMKVQNNLNYDVPLSVAEVSSTFMEDFVIERLLKEADDETKLSLIMSKLNDDVSTIFRQIACYQFEQELHKTFNEKNYLSYKEIGEIFQKHMKNYMGDYVEQSEGAENWWLYWSHIRRFFYVYSYASGLIISKFMQRKYRQNPEFIENIKAFLSAGCSKSPKDLFAEMGIDISDKNFWIEGVKETEDLLNEAYTLAKKLGKI